MIQFDNTEWAEVLRTHTVLACIDESEPRTVDQAAIVRDQATQEFLLVTASGCSCCDGEAYVERFATLDALEAALLGSVERRYNPSLRGAQQLIDEARKAAA